VRDSVYSFRFYKIGDDMYARNNGTGLDLSLSYDVVNKVHGGELKVESEDGKYTKFIISLPKV
jgi:signal transduction histidine kinase